MWRWLLELIVCPICRAPLEALELSPDEADAVLGHPDGPCREVYPVIGRIPRLLVGEARTRLARERHLWFASSPQGARFAAWSDLQGGGDDLDVVARFDREWQAFSAVGTDEQARIFDLYFDVVPSELLAEGRVVLDAGCGGGRWAFQAQRRGARVVAVDLGRSVEIAERNTLPTGRVACLQADVRDLPVRTGSVDLVYSLGVLHHVGETESALRGLVRLLRPGGALLLYLYYALDSRAAIYRALFRASDGLRNLTSRLPQPLLVALTSLIALVVYVPLARASRVLRALGLRRLAASLPLSFYADLSFETMRNDSLDRFGTRIEKRYTRSEVTRLLEDAGLAGVVVSTRPPFWHAAGRTRG